MSLMRMRRIDTCACNSACVRVCAWERERKIWENKGRDRKISGELLQEDPYLSPLSLSLSLWWTLSQPRLSICASPQNFSAQPFLAPCLCQFRGLISFSLFLSDAHTRTHAHPHARTNAHTHTHTHTYTYTHTTNRLTLTAIETLLVLCTVSAFKDKSVRGRPQLGLFLRNRL